MPLSPTTTLRLRQSEPVWPTVGLNARWPAPRWHQLHHSLKQQCRDMLCHPSLIHSLAWGPLLIKVATQSSPRQLLQSTTPMAIPFLQAGETKLDHASGTSLSPRRPHRLPQMMLRFSRSSRHHLDGHQRPTGQLQSSICYPVSHIPARGSQPSVPLGLTAQYTTKSMVQPRLLL